MTPAVNLDRDRDYAEVIGLPGVKYEQDGQHFAPDGSVVGCTEGAPTDPGAVAGPEAGAAAPPATPAAATPPAAATSEATTTTTAPDGSEVTTTPAPKGEDDFPPPPKKAEGTKK